MAKRYRVVFPELEVKGKKFKISGPVVLGDVYVRDATDKSVVTMTPVIVSEGYLDVDSFEKEDWNASLNGGIVKDLIAQGIIIVDDSDSPKKVKKSKKTDDSEVHIEDVSTPAEPVKVADVTKGIIGIKSIFSQKSYNEKLAYIKSCKISADLNELLDKENLGNHLKTLIKKQIDKLSK